MKIRKSPLSTLKSVWNELVGWLMLVALVTGIRAKDSVVELKNRLEGN